MECFWVPTARGVSVRYPSGLNFSVLKTLKQFISNSFSKESGIETEVTGNYDKAKSKSYFKGTLQA